MTTLRRALSATAATIALLAGATAAYAAPPLSAPTPGSAVAGETERRGGDGYKWRMRPTGSEQRFRGLSAVSSQVAWVSGTEGTVLRTGDGGQTWQDVSPEGLGTEELQFRDIEAFDAKRAVILSIGEGTDSRILFTADGGASWRETFRNEEPTAFYDCMAFTTPQNGLALSDPVDGKFRLARTTNGGRSWSLVNPAGMPPALAGEFAFAASGTCLTAGAGSRVYIASGGVDPARVFSSTDAGRTWTVADSPVAGGEAAGIFSVRFKNTMRGIAVGGDFLLPDAAADNAAWTDDGGATWQQADVFPAGYRSGSEWVPGTFTHAIAVGPSGSDATRDGGRTWNTFDKGSFDSVECSNDGACWASGEQGRVAVLRPIRVG